MWNLEISFLLHIPHSAISLQLQLRLSAVYIGVTSCAAWDAGILIFLSQDFFFSAFVTNVACQSVGDKCDLKRAGIGL